MIRSLVASDTRDLRRNIARATVPFLGDSLGNENLFGTLPVVDQRCYARYLGRWPVPLQRMAVWFSVTAVPPGAAGGDWAEVAIATGTPDIPGGDLDLTPIGATDVASDLLLGGARYFGTLVEASIPATAHLWALFSIHLTLAATSVSVLQGGEFMGLAAYRDSCRPSTNIGTPLAFVSTPTQSTIVPTMKGEIR